MWRVSIACLMLCCFSGSASSQSFSSSALAKRIAIQPGTAIETDKGTVTFKVGDVVGINGAVATLSYGEVVEINPGDTIELNGSKYRVLRKLFGTIAYDPLASWTVVASGEVANSTGQILAGTLGTYDPKRRLSYEAGFWWYFVPGNGIDLYQLRGSVYSRGPWGVQLGLNGSTKVTSDRAYTGIVTYDLYLPLFKKHVPSNLRLGAGAFMDVTGGTPNTHSTGFGEYSVNVIANWDVVLTYWSGVDRGNTFDRFTAGLSYRF